MSQDGVVYINISCLNLPSDFAEGVRIALAASDKLDEPFTEIEQTETVVGQINPVFKNNVQLTFRPETDQFLKFTLFLINGTTETITEKSGEVELTLYNLITCPGQITYPIKFFSHSTLIKKIQYSMPLMVLSATPSPSASRGTVMQFRGTSLSVSNNYQSAPYFIIELISTLPEKMPILMYRSEVVYNEKNPIWKEFTIPTNFFPSAADYTLQISCYNFTNNSNDYLFGKFSITFYQLLNFNGTNKFLLRNNSKEHRELNMELMHIKSIENIPTFINMLKTGFQLHSTVAIDFTANNKLPNDPTSLHYLNPYISNAYMKMLKEILPSLKKFDRLERFSLLGFGAKIPPDFKLSQVFALNGNINNSYVKSLDEALHFYRTNVMSVIPYAPTEYSGVIHNVIKLAKASLKTPRNYYFTLIIITNGAIRNSSDTINTIIQASTLPISIIFLVVGNAANPIGYDGDTTNLLQLQSPTLKSSNNLPLNREVVTTYIINDSQCALDTSNTPYNNVSQKFLTSLPRQITTWAIQKN